MKTRMARARSAARPPVLGEVLDFMRVTWALDHAMQRASKRMERDLGITGPQRLVLRVVGRFPSLPAGKLAELLHVDPSTLTGVLRRLERRGLIRRGSDSRDRRKTLLGLTDKGRAFDVDADGTIEVAIQRVLDSTPPHKLQAAREVLESIASTLESWNSTKIMSS